LIDIDYEGTKNQVDSKRLATWFYHYKINNSFSKRHNCIDADRWVYYICVTNYNKNLLVKH